LDTLLTPEQLGELSAIATAVLWTFSTLAWTAAGRYVGALAVSSVRLGITCLMLAAYGQIVRGQWFPFDAGREMWLVMGLSGIMGFLVADLCLFKAYLLIGPRLSLLVLSLSPPMAAVISLLTLGDRLSKLQCLGMVVTLAGVAWVVLERPNGNGQRHPHLRQGVILGVLAAAAQATGLVLSKRSIGNYDAGAATMVRALPALAGYAILIAVQRRWPIIFAAIRDPRVMTILTGGSIVGPFLGVILSLVALRHCPAGVVATILATMPVLILPASVLLHREKVSPRAVLGALLSVVGIAMLVL
jgi:drug/metabolite transporter (DMT)-like permease